MHSRAVAFCASCFELLLSRAVAFELRASSSVPLCAVLEMTTMCTRCLLIQLACYFVTMCCCNNTVLLVFALDAASDVTFLNVLLLSTDPCFLDCCLQSERPCSPVAFLFCAQCEGGCPEWGKGSLDRGLCGQIGGIYSLQLSARSVSQLNFPTCHFATFNESHSHLLVECDSLCELVGLTIYE